MDYQEIRESNSKKAQKIQAEVIAKTDTKYPWIEKITMWSEGHVASPNKQMMCPELMDNSNKMDQPETAACNTTNEPNVWGSQSENEPREILLQFITSKDKIRIQLFLVNSEINYKNLQENVENNLKHNNLRTKTATEKQLQLRSIKY